MRGWVYLVQLRPQSIQCKAKGKDPKNERNHLEFFAAHIERIERFAGIRGVGPRTCGSAVSGADIGVFNPAKRSLPLRRGKR